MTPDISIYQWAIEEMSLSGKGVSLHPCSSSTMYKWARECNAILAREKAGWRVKANMKAQALDVVWLSPETVKIAVVGRAVSGKSALVNALGRRFDGLSILDMPYKKPYTQFISEICRLANADIASVSPKKAESLIEIWKKQGHPVLLVHVVADPDDRRNVVATSVPPDASPGQAARIMDEFLARDNNENSLFTSLEAAIAGTGCGATEALEYRNDFTKNALRKFVDHVAKRADAVRIVKKDTPPAQSAQD